MPSTNLQRFEFLDGVLSIVIIQQGRDFEIEAKFKSDLCEIEFVAIPKPKETISELRDCVLEEVRLRYFKAIADYVRERNPTFH